ncbi:MAG: ABC transporter permease [Thermoanaerobaculia bacterium]|nr:ABC transporter permease [Thermoanaerobaculia bacterium]
MRLLLAFIRHEIAMQSRSMRFRATAAAYLVVASASAVLFALRPDLFWSGQATPGPFVATMQLTHPGLAAIVAWVIAVDAINRERESNAFVALMLNPIGNLGYVVRRYVAVALIVVTLTAIAALVNFGCAVSAGASPADCDSIAWVWLLWVVPVAIAMSAFALGAGTIAGNGMVATVGTILLLGISLGIGNDLLAKVGRTVEGPGEWINTDGLAFLPFFFDQRSTDEDGRPTGLWLLSQASDGPFEPREAIRYLLPRSAIWAPLSAAALLVSPVFLRRTRPDAKPWKIRPNHPLRTYLAYAKQLKEHMTPDAALPRAELAIACSGVALVALGFVFVWRTDEEYRRLARERFAAESAEWPEPTPPGLELRRVGVRGAATRDGALALRVTETFHNAGPTPVARAALELNHGLAARVDGDRTVTIARRWDRLEMRFAPPLAPGEERTVALAIDGVPSTVRFRGEKGKFIEWYPGIEQARLALWIPDFSRSHTERNISARQTTLASPHLFPLPRYAPWKDETDPRYQKGELQLELTHPAELTLASDAGAVGRREGESARLASASTQNLADVLILGGARTEKQLPGGTRLFVVRPHRSYADERAAAISDSLDRIAELWPEMAAGAQWVALEACRPFRMVLRWENEPETAITGAILELPESAFTAMGRRSLREQRLASRLRVRYLLSRRAVTADDAQFFRIFYDALAARELGVEQKAILDSLAEDTGDKMRAAMVDLRRRVGARRMDEAVAEFLSRPGTGSSKELFDILEQRSSVVLKRFYDDYVIGRSVPSLELSGVKFERTGDRWSVSGSVTNKESGEALCPVFLRTEIDRNSTIVTVPDGGSAEFTFRTPYKPLGVELDPNGECFRYQAKTARVGVTYR